MDVRGLLSQPIYCSMKVILFKKNLNFRNILSKLELWHVLKIGLLFHIFVLKDNKLFNHEKLLAIAITNRYNMDY